MPNSPLYQRLFERPYPRHQRLDKDSIDWLFEHLKPRKIPINSVELDYSPFPIDQLTIKSFWFTSPSLSIGLHGIRHLLRVALFTWVILQQSGANQTLTPDEQHSLLQAALVHDIQRLDDNADEEHGRRSAAWARKQFPGISASALFAVRHHTYDTLPNIGSEKDLLMLHILKAADALDRFRLPKRKWWPNTEIITLTVEPQLLEFCKYVTLHTERLSCDLDNFEEITNTLIQWMHQENLV